MFAATFVFRNVYFYIRLTHNLLLFQVHVHVVIVFEVTHQLAHVLREHEGTVTEVEPKRLLDYLVVLFGRIASLVVPLEVDLLVVACNVNIL